MDPVLHDTLRFGLALLFSSAAIHKARDLAGFRNAFAQYEIVPRRFVPIASIGLVAAEATIVLSLLWPSMTRFGARSAASLLAVYSAAIAVNIVRGRREIDCGCGGVAGSRGLGLGLVWRNFGLIGASLAASAPVSPRPMWMLDRLTIVFALATVSLAYYAASLLARTADFRLGRRLSP